MSKQYDEQLIYALIPNKYPPSLLRKNTMKKIILSIALLSTPLLVSANQYFPNNSNGFNMPNFNGGNGNNGSNWNMPNMNWGNSNGNGYSNGSNWNMPNMNWGSNNRGSNWNMPGMNWGNNNGYGNGSNWNMPNMNWGSGNGYNSGSNWNMPGMNWGNNNSRPWNYGNNASYGTNRPRYTFVPNPAYKPLAPKLKPRTITAPRVKVAPPKTTAPVATAAAPTVTNKIKSTINKAVTNGVNKIPKPNEIKGIILAPENKAKISPDASTPIK